MKKIYLCLMTFILQASPVFGEISDSSKDLVEYVEAKDYSRPYNVRRGDFGGLFELKLENLIPDTYVSPVDSEEYTHLWSSNSLQILQIGISQKTNFDFGSITIGAGYGSGEVNSAESGTSRTLRLTYPYLALGVYLDQILEEPSYVPYGKISFRNESIEESTTTTNYSKTLGTGMGYTFGMLFNIGKFDQNTSGSAYVNYGIENTYLDIFIAQYLKSENEEKIEIQNSQVTYGAGLVWEF